MTRALFLAALAPALSGCSMATLDAPSLLPRPIETRSPAEPVRTFPTVAPDPAFDAEVARRAAGFTAAARAFQETLAAVEPRIARGARAMTGSEQWLDAQAALTEIGGARGASESALVDLEELAIGRSNENKPPHEALDAAIAAAGAEVDRQGAAVQRLEAMLPPL